MNTGEGSEADGRAEERLRQSTRLWTWQKHKRDKI